MAQASRIRDLFQADVGRRIEEVVKVDQTNEEDVYNELVEYVVTPALAERYREVLDLYAETPNKPHEGIGVWVSGFFGSGKSSFAKILGYILENRVVMGRPAGEIFAERAADDRIRALLGVIHHRIPTTAIIFDVAKDKGVRSGSEMLTEIMYRAFLRELGYSDDLDLAELEISLEADGRLAEFVERYRARYGQEWDQRKRLGPALVLNEASAVMHEMDPATYPQPDSWAKTPRRIDVSANRFVERVMELGRRRRPGRRIVFVIDEVGQYVSRSVEKMQDLQGVVEALGRAGKGWLWLVVTSQEKLDEVVDSLEGRRIELARLRDRFATQVDMSPADISEVASRRVLTKKPEAEEELRRLYESHKGALATHTAIRGPRRPGELTADTFVRLYPFLPYQVDLIIDIVSGLRRQPGASRHVGGSNRTIIKHAQQMIIHPKVALGEREVGALVTLDRVYDLLETNVASERQRDIKEIEELWGQQKPLVPAVAKVLCLLEFEDKLPRTAENVAALLYPRVGSPSLQPGVEEALSILVANQRAKLTEKGYTLLSVEAKQWETERRALPEPRPAERARLLREVMGQLFKELPAYRYRDIRNFTAALHVNGEAANGEGDIPLFIELEDEQAAFQEACRRAREESRIRENHLHWVAQVSDEVRELVHEYYCSARMIEKYDRDRTSLSDERLLADEKVRQDHFLRDLRIRLRDDLLAGKTYFRGVERLVAGLGADLGTVARRLLEIAVPEVYPKFDLAAVRVRGNEAPILLTAANLNGLPPVCYEGEGGLGLVVRQGGQYAISLDAPAAREVLEFIRQQDAYGETVTGKQLENRFRGFGYGWEVDVLILIVAALVRGGALELSWQGRRAHSHMDPVAREAFGRISAFRAAAFRPRQAVALSDLSRAAQLYERLSGERLDLPEETTIAEAIRRFYERERDRLTALRERLAALGLPGAEVVGEALFILRGIAESPSDDAVKTFAEQGEAVIAGQRVADRLHDEGNLATLRRARRALQEAWPVLSPRLAADDPLRERVERLRANFEAPSFHERLPEIAADTGEVEAAYRGLHADLSGRRAAAYRRAIEEVRARPEWDALPEAAKRRILAPLEARLGEEAGAGPGEDLVLRPSLDQLETDLAAVDGLLRQALAELERLVAPEERVERVPVRRFFTGSVTTPEELEEALFRLREHCLKLLSEGARVIIE